MPETPESIEPVHTDQVAKQHLSQIADLTTSETGNPTAINDVQPAFEQHPLQGVAQSIVNISDPTLGRTDENESEVVDIIKGLQGKPRTGQAIDFLKQKMQLLALKTGQKVSLTKREK